MDGNGSSAKLLGAFEAELRTHGNRLDANHTAIGDLRASQASSSTRIEVLSVEHREGRQESREDIAQLRETMALRFTEVKTENTAAFTKLETRLDSELTGLRRTGKWLVWLAISVLTLLIATAAVVVPVIIRFIAD